MAQICIRKKYVALTCEDKAHLFRLGSDWHSCLNLPEADRKPQTQNGDGKKTDPKSDEDTIQSKDAVCCSTLSPCGKWLALCSINKQLSLWDTEGCSLVSQRCMARSASSITFTSRSEEVVIVDKSGDAFLYSVTNAHSPGQLILGHLSMLLDVVVTPDEKYVITCDRDEKIRVSHFPNAYNIMSYCLGHEEFVSSIALLPHDTSILVSSSGDGTIRLWNYLQGLLLHTHNCSSDAYEKLMVNDRECTVQGEESKTIAASKLCCGRIDSQASAVCVIMHKGHGCMLYQISDQGQVKFLQIIALDEEPLDVCFSDPGVLWVYTTCQDQPVKVFSYDAETSVFVPLKSDQEISPTLNKIQEISNDLVCLSKASNVPQLFKRRFDNVKDYLERKKARTGDE